jgi:hypothetical protein
VPAGTGKEQQTAVEAPQAAVEIEHGHGRRL